MTRVPTPTPPTPPLQPSQSVPMPQARGPVQPFGRVADGFKTDTWQVGLGAGWRS